MSQPPGQPSKPTRHTPTGSNPRTALQDDRIQPARCQRILHTEPYWINQRASAAPNCTRSLEQSGTPPSAARSVETATGAVRTVPDEPAHSEHDGQPRDRPASLCDHSLRGGVRSSLSG